MNNMTFNTNEFFATMTNGDLAERNANIALSHLFSAQYWEKIVLCKRGEYDETDRFYRRNQLELLSCSTEQAEKRWMHHLEVFARYAVKVNRKFHETSGLHFMSYLHKDNQGRYIEAELIGLGEAFIDDYEEQNSCTFESFMHMVRDEVRARLNNK